MRKKKKKEEKKKIYIWGENTREQTDKPMYIKIKFQVKRAGAESYIQKVRLRIG